MATAYDTPPLAPAEIEQQIPLASQVGGHPGVTSSADGNTIIKPCLPAEKAFYEAMQDAPEGSAMARLLILCPEFRGVTVDGSVSKPLSMCLQNWAPFPKLWHSQHDLILPFSPSSFKTFPTTSPGLIFWISSWGRSYTMRMRHRRRKNE